MPDASTIAARERQKLIDEARAEERRKVVEWLREEGADFASIGFEGARVTLDHAADTIERGEHHG